MKRILRRAIEILLAFTMILTLVGITAPDEVRADGSKHTYLTDADSLKSSTVVNTNVVWDSEMNAAYFHSDSTSGIKSYVMLNDGPFASINADTGCTITFEAWIDEESDTWGRLFDAFVDINHYFFISAGHIHHNSSGYLTTYGDGSTPYLKAAYKYGSTEAILKYASPIDSTAWNNSSSSHAHYNDYFVGETLVSDKDFCEAWHKHTLVIAPGGYNTYYIDDVVVEYIESNAIIRDVLNNISSFGQVCLGKSAFGDKDGFFRGYIRNVSISSGTEKNVYTEEGSLYVINYDTDGGSPVMSTSDNKLPDTLPVTTKTDYTFTGWFLDKACTKPATAGVSITKNTTLYAGWRLNDAERTGIPLYVALKNDSSVKEQAFTFKITPVSASLADGTELALAKIPVPKLSEIEIQAPTKTGLANKVGFGQNDDINPWKIDFVNKGTYVYEITQTTPASDKITVDNKTLTVTVKYDESGFAVTTDGSSAAGVFTNSIMLSAEDVGLISYESEEPSVIKYTDGYLHFDANTPHVIAYAKAMTGDNFTEFGAENTGIYIDLTDETFTSSFAFNYYSLDKGKKWYEATEITREMLKRWFSKDINVRLTDKLDDRHKKPVEDSVVYGFETIHKRPSAPSLKLDFKTARDDYGTTNGQWMLVSQKYAALSDLYKYEFRITDAVGTEFAMNMTGVPEGTKGSLFENFEAFKAVFGEDAWGRWPSAGGVWVPDVGTDGKTRKAKIELRMAAVYNESDNCYTAAGKSKKLTVSSITKAPAIKANYQKEEIKFKKGMSVYFGTAESIIVDANGVPSFYTFPADKEEKLFEDYAGTAIINTTNLGVKKALSISPYLTENRNTILLWQTATQKKPASARQTIKLEARYTLTKETLPEVSVSSGKAKVPEKFEILS